MDVEVVDHSKYSELPEGDCVRYLFISVVDAVEDFMKSVGVCPKRVHRLALPKHPTVLVIYREET